MNERPILFSAPMVRAVLAGTKTQTRRVAKGVVAVHSRTGEALVDIDSAGPRVACPYAQPGDRLWVRESWAYNPDHPGVASRACFMADPEHRHDCLKWKPSIHMPRADCRITLEVTGVRVERLQDISEADAIAEGIEANVQPGDPAPLWRNYATGNTTISPVYSYQTLWEQINGPGCWDANPWVWVVEFKAFGK